MSLPQKIFFNTIAQTAGKIIAIAVGLLNLGLLTRYLGEGGFGQYSTVLAFLGFVATFADFGLYLYAVREISRPSGDHPQGEKIRNDKILSNILGIRLVFSVTALVAGSLIALAFPYDTLVKKTMFIGILGFVFVSMNQALVGIFQKHLVQYLTLLAEILGRVVSLILTYLFITEHLSLPYFVAALVAGNGIIFIVSLVFARRYEKFSLAFDLSVWKMILTASWPLAFSVILNLLYFKTDTIILSVFHPEEAVGVYSLPYKILEVSLAFPGMFVGLMMPLLSRHAFAAWDKFRDVLQRTFDALFLTAAPMVIATMYFAGDMIDLIKGETDYADSPAVFKILIFAAAIIFLGTLFGYGVVAVNKQKTMIWGYLTGAAVGLATYFALIPEYSYFGAAVGTVLTEIVVAVFAFVLVSRQMPGRLSLYTVAKSLPALLVLILFFHYVQLPWIGEIILGLALYLLVLLGSRAIPTSLIRQLVTGK